MGLIGRALENPYAVIVSALATLIIGTTMISRMGVDILPTFKTPAVQILTFYPGMPAEIVEQDISTRLERWTGQANGVARQEAKSMIGVSIVKDFFRPDIDPNTAMSMTSALAMSDLYYLPPGTVPPMVMPFDPTATIPLAVITISSPTADETRLYDIAYFELRNKLQGITGVIAPAVYGGKLRRILAYVDPEKLHARGMSPMDVITAIRASNVLIPTGNAKFGDVDYQINANAMVDRVPEINDLPVKIAEDGRPIFVRDVAEAKDSAQIQTNIVRIDGRRQVYIPIYRQPGANTIAIVDGIRAQLKPIAERLPPDIRLDVVMDQSETVRRSIRHLQVEAVLGAGLAALMILLFLGSVRSTFIVALSLPLAVITALVGLTLFDQTINTMTLGGLALAVGLLIDQAIVMIENIERHLHLGKSPLRAALDGGREVSRAVLVITVTIIAVFCPVLFLTGMGKLLFSALALAVVCALTGSYVIAMTLVPVVSAKLLRSRTAHDGRSVGAMETPAERFALFTWFESAFERVRRRYIELLEWVLGRRATVVLLVLALFVASLFLAPSLGQELFPEIDSGQLMIRARAPSGLRIERTEEMVKEVEAIVQETIPEAERVKVISNIGVLLDWPAAYTPNSGPMDAFINVQLSETRSRSAQEYAVLIRRALNERLAGNEFAVDTGGMITAALTFGLPSPINLQVEGKSLEVGSGLAEQLRSRVAEVPGAVDVRIQQRGDYPLIQIDVDRIKAASLGLTQEQVVKNIVTALNSSINFAPSFWIDHSNGNHYFLGAQYKESDIDSIETLKNLPITGAKTMAPILLRNIASFRRSVAPTEVNHANIARVIDVYANVSGRDVGAVAKDIERAIADVEVPQGFRVLMRGEVETMNQSFREMGFGLLLAIILVYLVMVVQFRSFVDPLIIMGAVPLGIAGVIAMLFATNTTINIMSLMGVIMTIGIGVSYSILYVDFANRRMDEGKSVAEAIREAGATRLRPILMTSLAAILGMVPMAVVSGQSTTPLARAVIGGVFTSMLLTLILLPCLYTVLKRPLRRNAEAEALFGADRASLEGAASGS
ncbi:MAG: efflux RND transporter permease subunit [Deltaproteobacteria bacterium]|nr:efflux RND transporter permease subunit [Deltaproteobacteria bacterium]